MGLLLVLYPFAEIYAWSVFIGRYSFGDAFLLIVTTGAVGFFIMSMQGKATMQSLQAHLGQGQMPTARVIHRAAIMFGGLLILLPGLIAKAVGTLLVFPGSRHFLVWWMKSFLAGKIAKGSFRVFAGGAGGQGAAGPGAAGRGMGGAFGASFGGNFKNFGRGFPGAGPNSAPETPAARDVIEIKPQSIEHKEK